MANGLLYLDTTTYNARQSPFEVSTGPDTLTILAGDKLTIAGSLDFSAATMVGVLDETNGGTGQSALATGDTLYASAANTFSKLGIGNAGDVLTVAGGVPTWQATGAVTLQGAYQGGNTITVTAAEGVPTISNAADATNTLSVARTFAGGGTGVDLSMGAATTGVGFNVLAAGSGDAAFINNTGTGSAFTVQDGGVDVADITAAGAVTITPTSGQTATITTAGAGTLDFNSAAGITIDGVGVSIDNANSSANFSNATNGAAQDLTIGLTGATNSSILLNSTGTGVDAIGLTTSAGGLVASVNGTLTADAASLDLDATTTSHFTVTGAAADATVSSVGGSVNMTASEAAADAINITASAGAGGITASSGTGGITETTTGTMDLNSGPFTLDGTTGSIDFTDTANVTVTGASKDLTVASTGGSVNVTATEAAADAINITASAGAGGITASSGTGGITETTTGTMDLNSGPFTLDGSTVSIDGTDAVNVTATGASKDVTVNSAGGSVNITATENAVDAIKIQSTVGGTEINSAGLLSMDAGASADIDVTGSTTMTSTVATTIEAVGGNLTLDNQFATGKVILMTGTNTAATAVEIKSDNGTVQASVDGTGQADFNGNLDANAGLDVSGGNLTLDSNDIIVNTNKFKVDGATGDTLVAGNLTVQGTITGIQTVDMIIKDNFIQENVGYTTAVALTGGLVTNYLPTATATTTNGAFIAGYGGGSPADAQVTTTGSGTFALGDIIQISGSTDGLNDGFFEVYSHGGTNLLIRTVPGAHATVEPFTRTQFIAMPAPSPAASITKVTVSVIRAGTDGIWETGKGAVTGITYSDLATGTTVTLQQAYDNGNTITLTNADGNLAITTTSAGGGADLTVASAAGSFLATNTGAAKMDLGAAANTVNLNGPLTATGNQTINLGSGQLTTAGNMDVSNGIDMTGGVGLTLSGAGTDLFAADSTAIKLGNTAVAPDATIGSDGTDMVTTMAATANCVVKTGDAAGAKSFIVADSGAVPQMTVTSDGDLTITGTATIPTGESLKVGDVFLNEYGSGMQGKNTSLVPIVAGDTVKFNGSGNFEISGTPGLTGMSDIPVGVAAVNIGVGLWGNVYFSGPAVPVKDNSAGGLLAGGFAIFDTAGGVKNIAAGAAAGKELVYGGACSKIAGGMAYISLVIQKIAKV